MIARLLLMLLIVLPTCAEAQERFRFGWTRGEGAASRHADRTSGRTVRLSEQAPDDRGDHTKLLQAMLDSGASTVILDARRPTAIVTGPLVVRSNTAIVFEGPVSLQARSDLPTGKPLLTIRNAENVSISRKSSRFLRFRRTADITMRKADFADGEHRHAIAILGSRNVAIRDLRLYGSGGDGIYIGSGEFNGTRIPCRDITIERSRILDQARNGISVISVDGLVIRGNLISGTGHDQHASLATNGPWAAIDFEPNQPSEMIRNAVVEGNRFIDNRSGGIAFAIDRMGANIAADQLSVRMRDNESRGGWYSVYVSDPSVRMLRLRGSCRNLSGEQEYSACRDCAPRGDDCPLSTVHAIDQAGLPVLPPGDDQIVRDFAAVSTALKRYHAKFGNYPLGTSAPTACERTTPVSFEKALQPLVDGGFLRALPRGPYAGSAGYCYKVYPTAQGGAIVRTYLGLIRHENLPTDAKGCRPHRSPQPCTPEAGPKMYCACTN